MVEYDRTPHAPAREALRICVAGVGGAGSNVLDRISIDRTIDAKLISFQTDIRILNRSTAPIKIQMGTELMRGIGSGGDPDLGREAAMFSRDDIRSAIEGHDMVFISAGLGGGTGSGAAPIIAQIAKSTGAVVVVFAAVPFSFEGRRRQQQCRQSLDILEKHADALILFDNDRMGELVLPKDGIPKAFAQADQLIAQSIRAVTAMVAAPGLVKLGLGDLVAALRVSEGRCLFGFGEAKGQSRGTEALKRALKSPLINQGALLQSAKNLLVHVVGGESLTLAEVEGVMKQLGRHVPDDTQILFGLGIDPKLADGITISLISALSASDLAAVHPVEEAAPAREPVAEPPPAQRTIRPGPAAQPRSAPPSREEPPPAMDLFAEPAPATPAPQTAPAPAPVASHPVVATQPEPEPSPAAIPVPPPAAPAVPPTRLVEPPAAQQPRPAAIAAAPEPIPAEPEEIVYVATDEESPASAAATIEDAPANPGKPKRESARVRLMQFISGGRGSGAAVDHQEDDAVAVSPPPVIAPVPETAPVALPRTRTVPAVHTPAAPQPVQVAAQAESQAMGDAYTEAAPAPAVRKPAPVPATAAVGTEQPSFQFSNDERSGRFKDTEPSFSTQGHEDLDTPTWMRMRKRLQK